MFSSKGLIPPAITGLHNGDAIKAWHDGGIINVVGDNTRPVLMNQVNEMWPLMSTVASNGFAEMQITGRWATNIYYNVCSHLFFNSNKRHNAKDTVSNAWLYRSWMDQYVCWGKGLYDLLDLEKRNNVRHLLGLHHDPYMFHQANLNYVLALQTTINGNMDIYSLLQAWVETVTQEVTRLWADIDVSPPNFHWLKQCNMADYFSELRWCNDFMTLFVSDPLLTFNSSPQPSWTVWRGTDVPRVWHGPPTQPPRPSPVSLSRPQATHAVRLFRSQCRVQSP